MGTSDERDRLDWSDQFCGVSRIRCICASFLCYRRVSQRERDRERRKVGSFFSNLVAQSEQLVTTQVLKG